MRCRGLINTCGVEKCQKKKSIRVTRRRVPIEAWAGSSYVHVSAPIVFPLALLPKRARGLMKRPGRKETRKKHQTLGMVAEQTPITA